MMVIALILIPLLSSLPLFLGRGFSSKFLCGLGYAGLALVLGLAVALFYRFDPDEKGLQFVYTVVDHIWQRNGNEGFALRFGCDGMSLVCLLMSAIVFFLSGVWMCSGQDLRLKLGILLLLESCTMGVFLATDLVVFYVFFELLLIPMFFLIGIWGGENRQSAALTFFIYTALGSILILFAIIVLYSATGTTEIESLALLLQSWEMSGLQVLLWWCLFLGFAVKIPMVPLHTWLPLAHVQAPTFGSAILAGVLLKVGGYGLLRVVLPLFPEVSQQYAWCVYLLSVLAVLYASLVALAQEDMKRVIAYSSIAHMGFVTMGIFSFTEEGVSGAIFQMVSHGFITAGLFFAVGVIYDAAGSKRVQDFSGLASRMPWHAVVFMVMVLSSIGLPGTSGFVGEYLVVMGSTVKAASFVLFLVLGIVLSACYMLLLYRRLMYGSFGNSALYAVTDCSVRERSVFVLLILCVIVLGIYPSFVLSKISLSVKQLLFI